MIRKQLRSLLLGSQQALSMFGATTLVGILTGIPISMTLFCAGVGTLLFHLVTGGKVPIFLGSSFAFLAPFAIIAPLLNGKANTEMLPYAFGGVVGAGAVYLLFSIAIKFFGKERIMKLFPPSVCGSMIILIGVILAPVAVEQASQNWLLAFVAATVIIGVSIFGKGIVKLIPIIIGVAIAYLTAFALGLVPQSNFTGAIVALPQFTFPKFEINAIITFAVVALATILEHIGDVSAVGALTGKNYFDEPGLHRTLLGDGLATSLAGFMGGPANTTYSECTGTMALTGQKDPAIMRTAAVIAILLGFIPYIDHFFSTIPIAIIGGASFILYGMISAVGVRHIVENKVDFTDSRNTMVVATMLVAGLGFDAQPLSFAIGETSIQLGGLAMSAIIGVSLNYILLKLKNE